MFGEKLGNDWEGILASQKDEVYFRELMGFLKQEYVAYTIYPPAEEVFSAFRHTDYKDVKVVILGQDPYINPGEAHGMAFSVKPSAKIPPSLRNIFKELNEDLGFEVPNNGYLMDWAKEGVLLLNTVLTARAGASKSHSQKGWESFTNHIIKSLNNHPQPLVFMLWGRDAEKKRELIADSKHKVLVAAHPSPLAGGRFFGSKHFSKANEFLEEQGRGAVDWQLGK
ncbi:MAG: uracil-DNA glycosylase [Defluviitaleaceae bacterium]|nr:uracil-DNA glycosylase [Defluviitaleaceae bacterium]